MPIYEYLCNDCGLYFERLRKITESDAPQSCTGCGAEAQKLVSAVNHQFAHNPVGPRPQNTGVHQIDYNYDRVIGRDAEQKWKLIQDRVKHKRDVLRQNPGATGDDLSRTHDGSYRVMQKEERAASEAGRKIGIEAFNPPKKTEG